MLPRKSLIPLRKEFPRLRRQGKSYSSDSFGLVVGFKAKGGPQCAFIVSKKISGKSVVRHEVKRKLSAAIQPFLPNLPKNLELVFLAKPESVSHNTEELHQEILSLLQRSRLLTSPQH